MILYFDSYITDEQLNKGLYKEKNRTRTGCVNYKMPDKLAIAEYSLASYSCIDWSHVVVKYDLQNPSRANEFEAFVKQIFPKAILIRGRSDNQKKFQESVWLLESFGDDWVFCSDNVDHPFISYEKETICAGLKMAVEARKTNKFVVLFVSHCFENLSKVDKNSIIFLDEHSLLSEDEKFCYFEAKDQRPFSQGIINIGLMREVFFSKDFGNKRIVKLDLAPIRIPRQYCILPKKEICEHFDGYSHLPRVGANIDEIIPPLFIPPGFFTNDIKIAAYYPDYREGWVNINPSSEKYSFIDNKRGTDLKILVEHIPIFWKSRISQVDVNPNADVDLILAAYRQDRIIRKNFMKSNFAVRLISKLRNFKNMISFAVSNPDDVYTEKGSFFSKIAKRTLIGLVKTGHKLNVLCNAKK